jgi:hypothetical protein
MRAVDPLAFVASIVGSLAWPLAVLVLGLVFRSELRALLRRPLHRAKAGPVEVEWEAEIQTAKAELAASPESADAFTDLLFDFDFAQNDRLLALAELIPNAAVVEAFAEVERSLRSRLMAAGVATAERRSMRSLADQARDLGLLSDETVEAIRTLAHLRNLALHSQEGLIDQTKALQFVALCRAVIHLIERGRAEGPDPSGVP